VWNLLAVLALAVAAPADVTATKLDGSMASGQLQSWSAGEIVLTTAAGHQTIPTPELLTLQFSTESTSDSGRPLLELVDGNTLPLVDFTTAGQRATARLQPPSPAVPQSIAVSLDQVRAVRLQPLDAEVLPQWQEIRQLGVPSDLIVVVKRGGKSLDHLECVLDKITDTNVEIKLDGNEVRVPRSKVAGLIYYRSDEAAAEAPPCVLIGPDGLHVSATVVRSQGDMLLATTTSRLQLAWPLAGITSIDLSAGKLMFLSDVAPATASWQPLVGLPSAASRAAKYGQPRFNQSAGGGPLTLSYPGESPSTGTGEIRSFAKGITLRSRSELVYRLPRGYNHFLAVAGIEPTAAASGNVMLSVFGDDRLLVECAIVGSGAPLPLEFDITGVKRLRIIVDYGQNLDTGDWLNLCNARIVK
jgi:hypothetical protein